MSDCPRKYERYEQLCNKCQDYEWCQICDDGGFKLSQFRAGQIIVCQDGRYLCNSCVEEIEDEERTDEEEEEDIAHEEKKDEDLLSEIMEKVLRKVEQLNQDPTSSIVQVPETCTTVAEALKQVKESNGKLKTIHLGEGTFVVNSLYLWINFGVTIIGAGQDKTFIKGGGFQFYGYNDQQIILQDMTILETKQHGVWHRCYQATLKIIRVKFLKCGWNGVLTRYPVEMVDCVVSESGFSGVEVQGDIVTLSGSATMIRSNCCNVEDEKDANVLAFGLFCQRSAKLRIVSPLTKEIISVDNWNENWGGRGIFVKVGKKKESLFNIEDENTSTSKTDITSACGTKTTEPGKTTVTLVNKKRGNREKRSIKSINEIRREARKAIRKVIEKWYEYGKRDDLEVTRSRFRQRKQRIEQMMQRSDIEECELTEPPLQEHELQVPVREMYEEE